MSRQYHRSHNWTQIAYSKKLICLNCKLSVAIKDLNNLKSQCNWQIAGKNSGFKIIAYEI